jgi:large-conductance mechanosensitive channel
MGRNEIRLRRQRMSAGNIARHRNYGEILERHDREQKWKRLFKVFIYFLIVAFLLVILIIVVRWERRKVQKKSAYEYVTPSPSSPWLS